MKKILIVFIILFAFLFNSPSAKAQQNNLVLAKIPYTSPDELSEIYDSAKIAVNYYPQTETLGEFLGVFENTTLNNSKFVSRSNIIDPNYDTQASYYFLTPIMESEIDKNKLSTYGEVFDLDTNLFILKIPQTQQLNYEGEIEKYKTISFPKQSIKKPDFTNPTAIPLLTPDNNSKLTTNQPPATSDGPEKNISTLNIIIIAFLGASTLSIIIALLFYLWKRKGDQKS